MADLPSNCGLRGFGIFPYWFGRLTPLSWQSWRQNCRLTVSLSPSRLEGRRRLFPKIGRARAPVAVDVPGAPIRRFPFESTSSPRGNSSSCVSELYCRWMILRFCAGRAFPLDLVAKDLESGISSESSVEVFDRVRYGETYPNRNSHPIASHFVAERILPVLCWGPF